MFIGAAAKSRKWPAEYWIQLIRLIQQNYSIDIVVAGDKNDIEAANQIKAATNAQIIVGETSLKTIALYVKNATAIITNHTMLAHLAVCYDKPVVIISNGDNYYRYTMYNEAGIHNVKIVYSPLFYKWLKKNKPTPLFKEFVAVTKDITTIDPTAVFHELNNILFLLHSDRYYLSQQFVN